MKSDYVSPAHIISRINDILYGKEKLSSEDVTYLATLKSRLREIEKASQTKQSDWLAESDLNLLSQKLAALFLVVQQKLGALIDFNDTEIFKRRQSKLFNQFNEINADLFALLEVVDQQQCNQRTNLTARSRTTAIYRLQQTFRINYVASSQSADPLFGGYRKKEGTQVGKGICAGKVITWIYLCSEKGSPKYPLYAEESQHWYQEKQIQFRNECKTEWENIDIFTGIQRAVENAVPGKLYYFAIEGENSGHALGIRKRHDGVTEFYDPNLGNFFGLNERQTKIMVYLNLAVYILFMDFNSASLWCAEQEDLEPTRSYYPDRNTLNKSELFTQPENDEKKLVARFIVLLQKGMQQNQSAKLAERYFQCVLPFILDEIHDEAVLTLLQVEMKKTVPAFMSSAESLILQRRNLIKPEEFQAALKEKKQLLQEYRQHEGDLQKQMNELRDKACDAAKTNSEVSKKTLFSITEKMRQFSNLLTNVRKAKVVETLTATPITQVKKFVESALKTVTGFFKRNKADEEKTKKQTVVDSNSALTQERVELHQLMSGILMHLDVLIPTIVQKQKVALQESGLSQLMIREIKAKSTVLQTTISTTQNTLRELQTNVLTEFGENEAATLAEYKRQFTAILALNPADFSLLNGQDQNAILIRLEALLLAKIPTSEIETEKRNISAAAEQASLLRERQDWLAEINKLVEYMTSKLNVQDWHVQAKQEKTIRGVANLAHQYYENKRIYDALVMLKKQLDKLHLHTDQAIQQFCEQVKKFREQYPLLLTDELKLVNNFRSMLDKHYLNTAPLPTNPLIEELENFYKKLNRMRDAYQTFFEKCMANNLNFWKTKTTDTSSLYLHLSSQQYYAMAKTIEKIKKSLEKWVNPLNLYSMNNNTGVGSLIIQFKSEFAELDAWLADSIPDDLAERCVIQQTMKSALSPKLNRALKIAQCCEQIVAGKPFIAYQNDEKQLFSQHEVDVLNLAAKHHLTGFVLQDKLMNWCDYNAGLNMLAYYFENYINFDNTYILREVLNAREFDQCQPHILEKLAEHIDIIISQADIDTLLASKRRHLTLIRTVIANHNSGDVLRLNQFLDQLEQDYLNSGVFPSMSRIIEFMLDVSQVIPVYDFTTFRLRDDYQKRVLALLAPENPVVSTSGL